HFFNRVCCVEGSDEVALEDRRSILRVFVYQPDNRFMIGRAQQIDHENGAAWLRTKRGGTPQCLRISKMMQEAVANDGIKVALFETRIRQVVILQSNSRIESRLPNTTPAESQHGFGTIHAKGGDSRESLDESNRHIRRPASKIDHPATRKLREPLAKISRNLPMGFAPIGSRVGLGLLLFVHQFRFGYALHCQVIPDRCLNYLNSFKDL